MRVVLDGLELHDSESHTAPFTITSDGFQRWLGSTTMRREQTSRANAHGALAAPGYLAGKRIPISGEVYSKNYENQDHLVNRLAGILADGASGRLEVTGDVDTLWTVVELQSLEVTPDEMGLIATFDLELWAPDPRRFGKNRRYEGGSVQVSHRGNFAATPTVTVVGPVAAPYTVASQGRVFTVTQALSAGQVHKIDMATGWVYRDGVVQTGVYGAARTFTIPPGRQVLVTGPASMITDVPDTFN